MKKGLVVSYQCVSSPNEKNGFGGSLFSIVKAQKNYNLDFLYFGKKDENAEKSLSGFYNRIVNVDLSQPLVGLKRMVVALFGKPRLVCGFRYKKLKFINLPDSYDFVIFDSFTSVPAARYLKVKCKKRIAFVIDSMPLHYLRRSEGESFLKRQYSLLQMRKIIRFEKRYYNIFNTLAFVSSVDSNHEQELLGKVFKGTINTVTNGVFVDEIKATKPKDLGFSLIFTGIMSYEPNRCAVKFFVQEIFPIILKKFPTLKFYVVGKNEESVKEFESNNVVVTGMVDNIYSYIKGATVYVSPLTYGTGVKNKILEALACKTPIVATPISIEGIAGLEHGKNIILSSGAKEFADSVIALLNDKATRENLKNKGFALVENNYSWNKKMELLVGDLNEE